MLDLEAEDPWKHIFLVNNSFCLFSSSAATLVLKERPGKITFFCELGILHGDLISCIASSLNRFDLCKRQFQLKMIFKCNRSTSFSLENID